MIEKSMFDIEAWLLSYTPLSGVARLQKHQQPFRTEQAAKYMLLDLQFNDFVHCFTIIEQSRTLKRSSIAATDFMQHIESLKKLLSQYERMVADTNERAGYIMSLVDACRPLQNSFLYTQSRNLLIEINFITRTINAAHTWANSIIEQHMDAVCGKTAKAV